MDSNRLLVITSAAAVMVLAMPAAAQQATAEMHAVSAEGIGEEVGTIQLADGSQRPAAGPAWFSPAQRGQLRAGAE
jgi:hypothetical protein